MIDGITVLSQEMPTDLPGWVEVTILICVGLILVEYIFWDMCDAMTLALILTIGVLVGAFVFGVTHAEPRGQYEYKVTIDDNANFKEIYNNYKIIDVEGEIYTIRDKED